MAHISLDAVPQLGSAPASGPTVLLTGASGVLGSALADEFACRGMRLITLTRRNPAPVAVARHLLGDVTQPQLGLETAAYERLVEEVDFIVHSAALTSFTTDLHRANLINISGTNNVVKLARQSGAALVHVSTAFVARLVEFTAPTEGVRGPAAYLASKAMAETVVRTSGVPAVIVRPSIIIGDSTTGRISQFQGMHTLCGSIIQNEVPFLPCQPDDLVDFVPADVVARAVADLTGAGFKAGDHWLTAGPAAPTVANLIDWCIRAGSELGLATEGAQLLPRERVERLIYPAFAETIPPLMRRQLAEVMEMMRLFGSTALPHDWPGGSAPGNDFEEWFGLSMSYWARHALATEPRLVSA